MQEPEASPNSAGAVTLSLRVSRALRNRLEKLRKTLKRGESVPISESGLRLTFGRICRSLSSARAPGGGQQMRKANMYNNNQQLKEDFQHAEANYIAALNHMNGFTGAASELWQLRTAMEAAKRACDEAGVAVSTVEEWAKQERAKNEQWLRTAAERIPDKNAILMHLARLAIPIAIGSGSAMWLRYSGSTGWSLFFAYIAALFVYAFIYKVFPTPWMRLGRRAAERGVHLDLWGDARQKEFDGAWRMAIRRKKFMRVY